MRGVGASGRHVEPDGRKVSAERKARSRLAFGAENSLFIPSFSFPETEVELTNSKTHCPGSYVVCVTVPSDPRKFPPPRVAPPPCRGRSMCLF